MKTHRKVIQIFVILFSFGYAHATPEIKGFVTDYRKNGIIKLDEKTKKRVDDAFTSVILNDDKKAKVAYGRTYKLMPEFVQLAFDLRFRNFDRAKETASKLPYSTAEKNFWLKLIEKKPASIGKNICEWFKEIKFSLSQKDAESEEMKWMGEYAAVLEQMQKEQWSKNPPKTTELDNILQKYTLIDSKGNPVALTTEAQVEILVDGFFDKMRNAQRRDTRYYKEAYRSPIKVATYVPGFKADNAWNLYWALEITQHPKKNHYLRRLKGIIKDMRENMVFYRIIGSKLAQDKSDYDKALALGHFVNRYPFLSTFLRFDFSLNDCGYVVTKE